MDFKCQWKDLLNYMNIYNLNADIQGNCFAFVESNYQIVVSPHFVQGAVLDAAIPYQHFDNPNLPMVIHKWQYGRGAWTWKSDWFQLFFDLPFTCCDLGQNSYYYYSGCWWKVLPRVQHVPWGEVTSSEISKDEFQNTW